jgi:thioredoxin-dependent peroxiredoxin
VVIGVSKDTLTSHQKFRQKYDLKIKLASDKDTQVAEAFGVWVQKSMYGRTYMGLERSTFLIDPDGKLRHIWRKVKVPGHAAETLSHVQKLVQNT